MTGLQLFADDGVTRPPGVSDRHHPDDGHVHACPQCGERTLSWPRVTHAYCTRNGQICGYEWRRSAQLHSSELLPY